MLLRIFREIETRAFCKQAYMYANMLCFLRDSNTPKKCDLFRAFIKSQSSIQCKCCTQCIKISCVVWNLTKCDMKIECRIWCLSRVCMFNMLSCAFVMFMSICIYKPVSTFCAIVIYNTFLFLSLSLYSHKSTID